MNTLKKIDESIFQAINAIGFEKMDDIMILISSKFFWIPLYIYIIYLIYKNFPDQFIKILTAIGLLIFVSDFGSVELFKNIFERQRPCYQHANTEWIRIVDGCGGKYGFISSHASNAFAIAFFITLIFKNFRGFLLLFSWATIISFSRIYLGVHYPFDVLVGMFWALFVSLLIYYIYQMKIKNLDWIWTIWIFLICIWNFGWREAPPLADIIAAVIFSIVVLELKKKQINKCKKY